MTRRSPARRDLDRGRTAPRIVVAVCAGVLAPGTSTHAQHTDAPPHVPPALCAPADPVSGLDHSHSRWSDLLALFVRDGWVDYTRLHSDGQPMLDAYLRSLEIVERSVYERWSRDQQLAYWINAYNAYTIRLILNHYPLSSIRDIGILPGAPFRKRFIPSTIEGRTLSLNDVEHEILRKRFEEPRIHFAIVCASRSCPELPTEAFAARGLDRQLDEATRAFIHDPERNRYDPDSGTLYLSAIFKWFREDFVDAAGSLEAYVARYSEVLEDTRTRDSIRIAFLDYDWSLNGE